MFNKDIHRNFKLENPYELVKSGKWTLDAFGEMVASASADLNGDSQMTTDDQWGIAWQTATGGNIFFYGADEHLSDKNKDDIPYLSIGSDRSHTVFDKIQKMIADKSNYYQGADQEIKDIFTSGRSLFLTEVLYHVKSFRDSTVDFGVLPVPKFDENQKDYIQYVDSWCPSPAVVPVTAKNLDRAGFFLQIMAETGREYIRSEYYDKCLNGKFLRDEESSEMLDIIVSHYVVENAVIYGWGGLSDAFKSAMNGTDGLASLIASYKTKCESEIQKTIDIYQSLD